MAEPESLNTMFQNAFTKVSDGVYALTTQSATGGASTVVAVSQAGTNNAVQTLIPTAARITSVSANGKVTAPAALAAIATTPNLAIGTWDIEVTTFIGGTTAPVEIDNCKFNIGASAVATIVNPVPGAAGASANSQFHMRVQFGAATPVSVTAGAAGTAGAVYAASIIATRVI